MTRRLYRPVVPELAHWFGIRGADLADMPPGELAEYLSRLPTLPPVGGSIGYVRKGD